jgi:hypothetical protein
VNVLPLTRTNFWKDANAWWQLCCFGSRTLQQSQIEPSEHQDNSDVYYQPLQGVVPEEEDVHADNDRYQREHVKNSGGVALQCFAC